MSGWIVIPRWDDFQHRDACRSNVLPWIKLYTDLLSKPEYLELTHHQRGVLTGIWVEYARSRRQLRDSTVALTRQLGHRVLRRDLEALNDAGFIAFSASRPAGTHAGIPAGGDGEEIREQLPPSLPRQRQNGREGGNEATDTDFTRLDPLEQLAAVADDIPL